MRAMAERRSSYEYEDLLTCGRGELFGPGNAQLPLPPMLMFDRIAHIGESGGEHGKGQIVAEYAISPDHWYFREEEGGRVLSIDVANRSPKEITIVTHPRYLVVELACGHLVPTEQAETLTNLMLEHFGAH